MAGPGIGGCGGEVEGFATQGRSCGSKEWLKWPGGLLAKVISNTTLC